MAFTITCENEEPDYLPLTCNLTRRVLVRLCSLHNLLKTRLFKYIEIFTPKNSKFSDNPPPPPPQNSDIFQISPLNINCGYALGHPRRGGSNEYPQSMFLSRNKKNNVYPCKPQFYYTKVGFKGVKIIQACFRDILNLCTDNTQIFSDCLNMQADVGMHYAIITHICGLGLFFSCAQNYHFRTHLQGKEDITNHIKGQGLNMEFANSSQQNPRQQL